MSHQFPKEVNLNHRAPTIRIVPSHRRRIVRILFVDETEADVAIYLRELKRFEFAVSADWVQTPGDLTDRLRTQFYDLIVCGHPMPSWKGIGALELVLQLNHETPVIVSSDNLEQDITDEFVEKGAFDCVDKSRLNRLPVSVALAVEERKRRQERNRSEKDLRQSEARYRALLENLTYGICRFYRDGRFLDVNEALVTMLGYGSKDELMAVNLVTEIMCNPIERGRLFDSSRQTGNVELIEVEWKRKDGTSMKARLSGRQCEIEEGVPPACEIIAEDVTGQRASEDKLRRLATTDALTGLANYDRFSEILDSEITQSDQTSGTFAVLLFDLNGMKRINGRHGHLEGNKALRRMAEIVRSSCRSTDIAARYGGDEFVVLLRESGAEEAEAFGRMICKQVANDVEIPLLSASVGSAVYPKDGTTIDALLSAADRDLYGTRGKLARAASPDRIA